MTSLSVPNVDLKVFLPSKKNMAFFKQFVDMLAFFKYNTLMIEIGGAMEYKNTLKSIKSGLNIARHGRILCKTKEIQDYTFPLA